MTFKKLFSMRKGHRRKPRANAFMLESLEPRVMLSASPMVSAVVTTDHLDCTPGGTAVMCISSSEAHSLRDFNERGHGNDRDADEKTGWNENEHDDDKDEQTHRRSVGTKITLTSSDSTTMYGESVTFTATVKSSGHGHGRPVGIVSFYDGAMLLGIDSIADRSSGKGSTFSITTSSLNAGSHSIHAIFTGSALGHKSYNDSTSQDITQTVSQRTLTGKIIADDKVYDGTTAATVTHMLSGVLDRDIGNVILTGGTAAFGSADAGDNKTVTLTGAMLTGTAAGNYTLSSVGTDKADIAKANAVITLTGYYGTYDGAAHQAIGTATGVLGEDLSAGLNLSVTSHTNAGVYTDTITFADLTGNYKNTIKNVKSTINKANATIVLTGYYGTYDGAAHQATGTATGVLGEDLSAGLNLSVTSHTNAGVYTDTITFADLTGNYKNTIKNVKSTINKANAVIALTGYVGTYDGAAHEATGTATGVLGEDLSAGLNLSVTSHTNAGTYIDTVTFTDVTGNYKNTIKNVKSTINKANAVITVTGYAVRFDGLPHTATGTAMGLLGEDLSAGLDLSSTTHSNVGAYLDVVTFTDATGNYKNTLKNVSSRIL